MLDITFIWAIDFRVIDFNAEWQQYERVMVGLVIYYSHIYVKPSSKMQTKDPLSSSPTFLIILLSFGFPSFYYAVVSCHLERRWCWRPENTERSNLARRSLHLHGSDCCGQWHCLLWSQDCRSVSAWGEHRCKELLSASPHQQVMAKLLHFHGFNEKISYKNMLCKLL